MGDKSGISWTNDDQGNPGATWNPLLGCEKVSPGCTNCYAIRVAAQMQPGMRMANAAYTGLVKTFPDGSHNWTGEVRTLPERMNQPSRWAGPRRIFVNSMSDLFHKDVAEDFIRDVFVEMGANPRHTFLVLTKRPEIAAEMLSSAHFRASVLNRVAERLLTPTRREAKRVLTQGASEVHIPEWPLPNVHLGTSVEDQDYVSRIDALINTPATIRFLSLEPLLGPIDLGRYLYLGMPITQASPEALQSGATKFFSPANKIHWVITGGESGGPAFRSLVERCPWCSPSTRSECEQSGNWMDGPCTGWVPKRAALEWVTTIMRDCHDAGVAFFHKQWGGTTPHAGGHLIHGVAHQQFPTPFRIPAVGVPSR